MADLEERRANVLRSLGRQQEAVAAFEAAISGFISSGEPLRAATASVPLVWIHGWAGEISRTQGVAQRALEVLGIGTGNFVRAFCRACRQRCRPEDASPRPCGRSRRWMG